MGLSNFFRRFSKREDQDALELAEEETHMSSYDRDVEQEDYEAHKVDQWTDARFGATEAERGESDFDSL